MFASSIKSGYPKTSALFDAMDLHVHAADGLDSALVVESSDGYFASQALRAGLLGGAAMRSLPPTNSDREAIGREIMKERIREEILAREMAERRILEEEVRRELEMERITEIRRFQMERWSGLAGTSGMVMHGDRQTQTFMPSWLEARRATSLGQGIVQDPAEFALRERSSSHLLQKNTMAVVAQSAWQHKLEKRSPLNEDDVEFAFREISPSHLFQKKTLAVGAQSFLQHKSEKSLPSNEDDGEFVFCEILPSNLLQKKTLAVEAQSSLQHKSEKSLPSNETTTLTCKLSGAKRKARGEFLLPAEKQWGCALCKVSATGEEALKEHLQGKKHKANEALLSNKKIGHLQSKKNVTLPLEIASTGGLMKKKQLEGQKQQKLWCSLCKVKCNSSIMMEYHLAGKRHKAFTELKKTNSFKTEAVKEGANEILGDAGREGFIKDEVDTAYLSIAP